MTLVVWVDNWKFRKILRTIFAVCCRRSALFVGVKQEGRRRFFSASVALLWCLKSVFTKAGHLVRSRINPYPTNVENRVSS